MNYLKQLEQVSNYRDLFLLREEIKAQLGIEKESRSQHLTEKIIDEIEETCYWKKIVENRILSLSKEGKSIDSII